MSVSARADADRAAHLVRIRAGNFDAARRIAADREGEDVEVAIDVGDVGHTLAVRRPNHTFINGRMRSFEYKLLNYDIQGSAADYTKEGLCQLFEAGFEEMFRICVHDEDNFSVPGNLKTVREVAIEIGRLMCLLPLTVPMLSDAEQGKNWGTMKKESQW